jgi:hypothetical protein
MREVAPYTRCWMRWFLLALANTILLNRGRGRGGGHYIHLGIPRQVRPLYR